MPQLPPKTRPITGVRANVKGIFATGQSSTQVFVASRSVYHKTTGNAPCPLGQALADGVASEPYGTQGDTDELAVSLAVVLA